MNLREGIKKAPSFGFLGLGILLPQLHYPWIESGIGQRLYPGKKECCSAKADLWQKESSWYFSFIFEDFLLLSLKMHCKLRPRSILYLSVWASAIDETGKIVSVWSSSFLIFIVWCIEIDVHGNGRTTWPGCIVALS